MSYQNIIFGINNLYINGCVMLRDVGVKVKVVWEGTTLNDGSISECGFSYTAE